MATPCDCPCHLNKCNPCDQPGGCGSNHRSSCITCPVIRPDSNPRPPHQPPVCDGDRALLDRHLVEIANLIAALSQNESPVVDQRRYERHIVRNVRGRQVRIGLGATPADPLAAFGGVAPINSRTTAPTVSGSRERPIPIPVALLDLKSPAKVPCLAPSPRGPHEPQTGWPEDQIGYLSAATVLDQWVRDVRDTLFPDHHLPPATVDELVSWLRNRLTVICDKHTAVDDMAYEIRQLRGALRSIAGETEPRPERCVRVPCKRCNQLSLYRQPDRDVTCINPDCQTVLRGDEYADWVRAVAEVEKGKQHADQSA